MASAPSDLKTGRVFSDSMYVLTEDTALDTDAEPDALPAMGRIVFIPQVNPGYSKTTLTKSLLFQKLDGFVAPVNNGTFSIKLPVTDDPSMQPSGWNYKVSMEIVGQPITTFYCDVTAGDTNFVDLIPADYPQKGVQILQGPPGPGRGIRSITDTDSDGVATITYTDDTLESLPLPHGPEGPRGRGVTSITDTDGDGTATVLYSDNTSDSLPLPKGPQGDQGPPGVGMVFTQATAATDFNTLTTQSIVGIPASLAASSTNAPALVAMEVEIIPLPNSNVMQRATAQAGDQVWQRSRVNGAWSTWRVMSGKKRGVYVEDYLFPADPANPTPVEQSAAWKVALDVAKANANYKSGTFYRGLPKIYPGAREWQLAETIVLRSISGLTFAGDGVHATVLRVDSGIPVFEVHRSAHITWEGMLLSCGKHMEAHLSGLIENSVGVWIHESSTENSTIPGSTTAFQFNRVIFSGFHMAEKYTGDQMSDNVVRILCRYWDNFIDVEMANSQSVNQRFVSGELVSWLGATEAQYNARLASWSSASIPASAKTGQYQDPAASSGTTQSVTVRDGACFHVMMGGEFHIDDRVSIQCVKTVLLFQMPPTSGAQATYGATANFLPFIFEGATGELRLRDDVGDKWGHQRVTLLRFEKPYAVANELQNVSPIVMFKHCRWTLMTTGIDLVHLAGPAQVKWHDVKVYSSTGQLRLCHIANAALSSSVTYTMPGEFDGDRSSLLDVMITAKDTNGSAVDGNGNAWPVPVVGTHYVRQRNNHGGAVMGYENATAPMGRSRLRVNDRALDTVSMQMSNADGTVIGGNPNLNGVGGTRTLHVGVGSTIRRVGISITSQTSTSTGATDTLTLRFRNSSNTLTYVDLTATYSATASATESVGAYGKIFNNHRHVWADIQDFAPTDGKIVIEIMKTTTGAVFQGFAWVEAY